MCDQLCTSAKTLQKCCVSCRVKNVMRHIDYRCLHNTGVFWQDVFCLIDLVGYRNPRFRSWFQSTQRHFQQLQDIGNCYIFIREQIYINFMITQVHMYS